MVDDVYTDELKDRLICADCVGEAFLSDRIEREGEDGACHYCSGEGKTFPLAQMAECTSTAISQHYQRTDVNPTSLEYAHVLNTLHGTHYLRYPSEKPMQVPSVENIADATVFWMSSLT